MSFCWRLQQFLELLPRARSTDLARVAWAYAVMDQNPTVQLEGKKSVSFCQVLIDKLAASELDGDAKNFLKTPIRIWQALHPELKVSRVHNTSQLQV